MYLYNHYPIIVSASTYFYKDSDSTQYEFYSLDSTDPASFFISGWNSGSGTFSGKILQRVVDNAIGSLSYYGMKVYKPGSWPNFDNPDTTLIDTQNFKENYILYGIKTIELNKQDVIKMLYQFIFPRMIIKSKNDLIDYIATKYPYIARFNNNNELMNISTLILCKLQLLQFLENILYIQKNIIIIYIIIYQI